MAKIIGGIKDDIRKEVQEEHKQQQKAWMRAIVEKQWQNLEIMKQELKKALFKYCYLLNEGQSHLETIMATTE